MEKKKQRIYAVIALVTLALLVVSATYAYFQNQYGDSSQTDVKVTTYTTDLLTFETGDAINITADQDTFAQGKGNQTGSSFAKAILQANSKTNVATANYYIYLNIESNEFTYTSEDNKAELVLQVTDNSGNPVTSIDGLTYVTVVDGSGTFISGFDITEKKGLITLVNNKEISASSKTEEQYNISLVLVNYDFDQNNNTGKNFNAKLMIQKEKVKETIAMVCNSGQNLSDCIKSMNGKDDTLYYHDSSLENGAGDNSYRYAGGDHEDLYTCTFDNNSVLNLGFKENASLKGDCNNVYKFTSSDESEIIYFDNSITKEYKLDKLVPISWDSSKSMCISSDGLYVVNFLDGQEVVKEKCVGNGYKAEIDGQTHILSGIEYMGAGIYALYSKANFVNNYVCFGSDEATCPVDNLYRIIGVFDGRVKLIKADYATSSLLGTDGDYRDVYSFDTEEYKGSLSTSDIGGYYWNYNGLTDHTGDNKYGSNTWSTSLLNKTNLNTNYLNNIGSKWADMIDTVSWKVGGNTGSKIYNQIPSVAYQNEVINPVTTNSTDNKTEYTAKIGLMYASDYGFAADPSAWETILYDYNSSSITNKNWMYMGLYEWTISRFADYSRYVFHVNASGNVSSNNVYASDVSAARPVFFLSSLVYFASGDGSASNPIRVKI